MKFEKHIESILANNLFPSPSHIPKHVAFLVSWGRRVQFHTNVRFVCQAEQAVLRPGDSWRQRKRLRLYVTKVGGAHRMSRPCWICSRQLKRIPNLRVFYTDTHGSWVEDTTLDSTHKSMRDYALSSPVTLCLGR